jgi:hypothetical protein
MEAISITETSVNFYQIHRATIQKTAIFTLDAEETFKQTAVIIM